MKPGRELDALVAEKVMGWTNVNTYHNGVLLATWGFPPGGNQTVAPHYSTSIEAAWKVVRRWYELNKNAGQVGVRIFDDPRGCDVQFDGESDDKYEVSGESVAHAICLAALKTIGEKDDNEN